MKTTWVFFVFLFVIACASLAAPASFAQCVLGPGPGHVTISYSWPPSAYVGFAFNNVPSGSMSTAIANWNYYLTGYCSPTLLQGSIALNPTVNMTYGPIPPPSNCPNCVTRGTTDLNGATFQGGRIFTVNMTINSAMTNTDAITEVVAHEIGHTFALTDCNYPVCPLHSSVMESNAPVASVNDLIGLSGPNNCDMNAVLSVATDYNCSPPPPPPPPTGCSRIETCTEGYAWNTTDCACEPASPIILDISGRGFDLTSAANGVKFDISGANTPLQMGWTASGADNAFLALPGADGLVHNGKQLFGNFTPQPTSNDPNGFRALAVYDDPKNGGNGDGIIDSRDAIFSWLRLWIDANHDGISQPEELHTLPSLGVNSISLDYHLSKRTDQFGNSFRYKSKVNPDDPDQAHVGRTAYDVFLLIGTTSTTAANKARTCVRPPALGESRQASTTGK